MGNREKAGEEGRGEDKEARNVEKTEVGGGTAIVLMLLPGIPLAPEA